MRIADLCIRRPVTGVMLPGALVVAGLLSLPRLGVDLFPRVEFPFIAVTTVLEGATPETVESQVTDVLENSINTVAGIEELRSVSSEGLSQIFVQFELEEDVDARTEDVREKVALARPELPLEAQPPVVTKVDPDAAPILSVLVAGPLPVGELTRFAEDVVEERIQRIPGVGSTELVGGREREIRIWADPDRLWSRDLTALELVAAIRAEHADLPGGHLETPGLRRELVVRTEGEVAAARDFADLAVAWRRGRALSLGEVARVEDGLEDERSAAELDGVPGVAVLVRRQSGRNTVQVAAAVRREVEALRAEAPPGIRIEVARDLSRFIEASARDVGIDMAFGAALAVLVTLAFLRSARATWIVAMAIPASVVASFFFFGVLGFTLNILTLMALSVSIGLLIDDAIVVLESIHRRIEEGEEPRAAASRGTAVVGTAVVAGTLSVLAVFVPIAFMRGMIGRFFYEYGLAISAAVAVSLLVAVTLTPMLCSRWLRPAPGLADRGTAPGRLAALYAVVLAGALRHRGVVIAVAGVAVAAGGAVARTVPLEFAGKVDRSELEARVELAVGSGIGRTREVARRAAEALRAIPEVRRLFVTAGGGLENRVNEASLYVELLPKSERDVDHLVVFEKVRATLRRAVPEARRITVSEIPWISGGGFTAYHVEYDIRGPDLAELRQLGDRLARRMRSDPRFVDVRTSIEPGKPELALRPDRALAGDLGIPLRALAETVRALVGGLDVATFEEAGRRFDVRLRVDRPGERGLAGVASLPVRTAAGALVEIGSVAELTVAEGPSRVDRKGRERSVTLYANTPAGVALGTAAARLDELVAGLGLPPGYRGAHAGMSERMRDSARSVLGAFLLALAALYVILAVQFDSFGQPLVIMVAAPLSFVGAFSALSLTGTPLNIFAQIGIVALMGLVMKNGILLVDYANRLREAGRPAARAMLEAGRVRLRPVLMTAISTFIGMIPVAASRSDGAEWRNPMGIIVLGGLFSSTLLTLVVVPVVYTLAADAGEALRRARDRAGRWRRGGPAARTGPAADGAH